MKWCGVYSNPWIIKDCFRMCTALHLGTCKYIFLWKVNEPSRVFFPLITSHAKPTLCKECNQIRLSTCILKGSESHVSRNEIRFYVTVDDSGNYAMSYKLNICRKIKGHRTLANFCQPTKNFHLSASVQLIPTSLRQDCGLSGNIWLC